MAKGAREKKGPDSIKNRLLTAPAAHINDHSGPLNILKDMHRYTFHYIPVWGE